MKAEKRNAGIELLKICSMYMIVTMHVMGANQADAIHLTRNELWYIALHPVFNCAVDVFALISGYVQYKSQNKVKSVLYRYGVVWFYSVVITFGVWFYEHEAVTVSDRIYAFFPLLSARYWYYTAYMGMSLFASYLKRFVSGSSKNEDKILLCKIIVVSTILPFLKDYGIGMKDGFSMWWLLCLYMIGLYLAKYEKEVIRRKAVIYIGGGYFSRADFRDRTAHWTVGTACTDF